MKRVLFILSLFLFSCSTGDSPTPQQEEEEVVTSNLQILLRDRCEGGANIISPYVSREVFDSVTGNSELCDEISFNDINGDYKEGLYSGYVGS